MVGTPVIVEGKILKVTGLLMGKPAYLLSDSTGQIVVRRFALPDPLVGVGAAVEVVGTVARTVSIKPIRKFREDGSKESGEKPSAGDEKIHIKRLH